jgi:hypothetical protein
MKKVNIKSIVYILAVICSAVLLCSCDSDKGAEKPGETAHIQDAVDEKQESVIVVNEVASGEAGIEGTDIETNEDKMKEDTEGTDDLDNMKTEEADEGRRVEEAFYMTEITDELFDRIYGKSFKEDCTLPREDLRYLHVLHKDIVGRELEGEMIVNVHIAEDVLEIMKELYENDYPIEKIRLVDEYGADDELSMEDNNSSSFNFRFVPRTKKISKHGRGLAIDINPLYNPYITKSDTGLRVEPVNAGDYADRDKDFDYKIEKGDLCYDLFISHGFEWGGEWKNSKDYQHFEVPTDRINEWYP